MGSSNLQELHLKCIVQPEKYEYVLSLVAFDCLVSQDFEKIQKDSWCRFFIAGKQIHKMKDVKLSLLSIGVDVLTLAVSCSSLILYYAAYELPFSDQH